MFLGSGGAWDQAAQEKSRLAEPWYPRLGALEGLFQALASGNLLSPKEG